MTAGVAFALVGVGFLLAAGFTELANLLGAVRAGLIIGAVLLVVGTGFIFSAYRRTAAIRADQPPHDPSAFADTMVGVGREIGAAAARHPGSLVLAAFIAGMFLSGGRRRR